MLHADFINYVQDVNDDISFEASLKRDRDIHNIWVKSMYSVILLTYCLVVYFDLPIPSDDVIIIILKFLVKLQHVFSTVFKNFSA